MSVDVDGAAARSEVMVENRETLGAEELTGLKELSATREGLETAGMRDCKARGALEVSRRTAEEEADMID